MHIIINLSPDKELDPEPGHDKDLEVVQDVFGLVLVVVVLDGGEDGQAEADKDGHKAAPQKTLLKLMTHMSTLRGRGLFDTYTAT